jgi:hypothetical protein
MKSFAPDYLATPIDQMPRRFWELLFPVPYQKDLVRNAKLQNLDACMVAALIRQESEFNPGAISRKNAYGLTQIMPATGRQLARRNGVRRQDPRGRVARLELFFPGARRVRRDHPLHRDPRIRASRASERRHLPPPLRNGAGRVTLNRWRRL